MENKELENYNRFWEDVPRPKLLNLRLKMVQERGGHYLFCNEERETAWIPDEWILCQFPVEGEFQNVIFYEHKTIQWARQGGIPWRP